jgi:alpha-D-ribose 1-methylphosphonate 5-phosphate C-P lyase
MNGAPGGAAGYNFAYLDEQTKRMIRRAILKAVAIPGYQCRSGAAKCLALRLGTGGIQVTAAIIGRSDTLKVIDQGADDTTNAVNIRRFFQRTTGVATTTRTGDATIVQTATVFRNAVARRSDTGLPSTHSRASALARSARERDTAHACAG